MTGMQGTNSWSVWIALFPAADRLTWDLIGRTTIYRVELSTEVTPNTHLVFVASILLETVKYEV